MVTIKHTRESIAKLEQEREQFKQQRDELIEDIQAHRDLLKEFSKFIDYKLYIHPGNCTYLSYRNELDQLGICKENEWMEEINYEKAWQMLKEEKTNNYITYPNAEKRDDLIRMDELDGTYEFSNLLDDMNREDK